MPEVAFNESDHPRDTDGQFTAGGGGAGKAVRSAMVPLRASAKLPGHIRSLKVPPGWSDVRYAADPRADLLVSGRDSKGRPTAIYSESHHARQAATKFARVAELYAKFDTIRRQNAESRKDPAKRDVADCLDLIMHTGIRPGRDADSGAAVKAYGATTLEGRHVRVRGGKVSLSFIGKHGVALEIPVTDAVVARRLIARKEAAGARGRLFGEVNDRSLLAHSESMDGGGFKTKDFRTHLGTATAAKLVAEQTPPTDEKSYRRAVMTVARAVAAKLGNTPTVALQAYINPTVFAAWRSAAQG